MSARQLAELWIDIWGTKKVKSKCEESMEYWISELWVAVLEGEEWVIHDCSVG